MSLINQMLQELDARRSEVTGTDSYGQQIRAVPERRHVHPAWWVALGLAVILAGMLSWLLLRPPVRPTGASIQLPLKLDLDLSIEQPQLQTQIPQEKVSETVGVISAPSAAPTGPAPLEVAAPPPIPAASSTKSSPVIKPDAPGRAAKEPPAAPIPEIAKLIPATRSLPDSTATKSSDSTPPVLPAGVNKQIKELTPQQRAENEYRKALFAMQQGRAADATGGLELALQLDPQHAGARQALISLLLENKRQDEAMRKAREGISLDAAQPGLAMILARLQLEKGELRSAIETLERTLPYAADRPDYQAFLAALLQRDQKHKQAVEHYLQALQRAPQNGVWWMGLGISLQADHRAPEAQEAFKRAKATNTLSTELAAFVEERLNQLQH